MKYNIFSLLLVNITLIAILLLPGCAEPAGTLQTEPAGTSPALPGETSLPTQTLPRPSDTPSPILATPTHTSLPSLPEAPLSTIGPWWIFAAGPEIEPGGIWGLNADGTGLTQLFDRPFYPVVPLQALVSPSGDRLAVISAKDSQLRGLTLDLIEIPGGQVSEISPLSSSATELEPSTDPAMRPPEALVAITQESSLAWSPDGRMLAFMGAFEGPSADLYLYDLETAQISRLTDGPSEGIRPVWSPDGEFILHYGVRTLGSGAGIDMVGVWAARADGSEILELYDPSDSSDEILVGWLNDRAAVVYTVSVGLSANLNLRSVNIETGQETLLWAQPFNQVSSDPDSGNFLILVDEVAANQDTDLEAGVYLVRPDGTSLPILREVPLQGAWSAETGLFLVRTEFGLVAISPGGDWKQLHDFSDNLPVANPVTRELAWYGMEGLWVGNLISSLDLPQPQQIFDKPVTHVSWSPQGEGLYFFGDQGLYFVDRDDLRPILVVAGLRSHNSAWVSPNFR